MHEIELHIWNTLVYIVYFKISQEYAMLCLLKTLLISFIVKILRKVVIFENRFYLCNESKALPG